MHIIFSTFVDIPEWFMVKNSLRGIVRFNLNSLYDIKPSLNYLRLDERYMPTEMYNLAFDSTNTVNFDSMYFSYIDNNIPAFNQMMSMIIPAFNDPDVLVQVLIDDSVTSEYNVVESLIKFVSTKYGYSISIVRDLEDLLYLTESEPSLTGLFSLTKDIDKWRTLLIGSDPSVLVPFREL